jgi:Family of unknown function (DUF6624)
MIRVTSVSAVWAISPFRLNLTIQTLVCLLLVGIVPIPLHTQNNMNLIAKLEIMLSDDQKFRGMKKNICLDSLSIIENQQAYLDSINREKLKKVICKHGWPKQSKVGEAGSLTAFLIVQHSNLEFQKEILPQIISASEEDEIRPDFVAYLQDRILVLSGEEQIYGTQLKYNEVTAEYELYPIANRKDLAKRRKLIGLVPIDEYLKQFNIKE